MANTTNTNSRFSSSAVSSFLSYLVFQAQGLRIGLEITFCVFLFCILSALLPPSTDWQAFFNWGIACVIVAVFDKTVLCRSANTFREVCLLDLQGKYEKALTLLNRLSPSGTSSVPCTPILYHLTRARIYGRLGRVGKAESELSLAGLSGACEEDIHLTRCRVMQSSGNLDSARREIEIAKDRLGETAHILLESGLIMYKDRNDLWGAKKAFRQVAGMPNYMHHSGLTTKELALAYYEMTKLWTGEAEEGLEGLSFSIEQLKIEAYRNAKLRPLLAFLLLERAYYLATHQEPKSAALDAKEALALCVYPAVKRRAEQVDEELAWRR